MVKQFFISRAVYDLLVRLAQEDTIDLSVLVGKLIDEAYQSYVVSPASITATVEERTILQVPRGRQLYANLARSTVIALARLIVILNVGDANDVTMVLCFKEDTKRHGTTGARHRCQRSGCFV